MFLKMYSVLTIKKGFLLILFFTFLSCGSDDEPTFKPEPIPSVDAKVTIYGTKKSHTISPMIQGHGLSYSVEKDIIYNDGTMAQLYKDVGAGFLRWPGGTPTTCIIGMIWLLDG